MSRSNRLIKIHKIIEERNVKNIRKITDVNYISFVVAAQYGFSCVKAAECYSKSDMVLSHVKINRFLTRQSLTPEKLWNEFES
mgnify:CR=1 FL=1